MHIYQTAKRCEYHCMDINSIRRANLLRLMAGKKKAELAEKWGTSPSTLSQITSRNHNRNLGSMLARKIEKAEGLDPGWLDQTHGPTPVADYPSMTPDAPMEVAEAVGAPGIGEVDLPYFREVELEGGDGRTQVIENHGASRRFSLDTLAKKGVSPENAACATLVGNSMESRIQDGSPIAIDKGCTQIIDGKIYAIDHGGMLRVKYLYRLPLGRIRIASENSEEYPDEIVSPPDLEELRIIGRVFWWESYD